MDEGQQGGHGWAGTAGRTPEPDWAALADRNEQDHRRRKQRQVIGAVIGATLVIGGITATAVNLTGKGGSPTAAAATPSDSPFPTPAAPGPAASGDPDLSRGFTTTPEPSTSISATASKSPTAHSSSPTPAPRPDPLAVISTAGTDTAPLDPAALFPAQAPGIGGHTWTRVTTATTTPCWKATTGGLGNVLAPQGCQSILRATYASGTAAVTVGIAVFDHRSQADAAQAGYQGQLQGLVTPGSISFCTGPGCATTHGAIGRYAYYTVAGALKPGGATQDPTATAAAPSFATLTQDRLLARGH
ncbi:hypothetical protein CFP65_6140 [Kitasatospora sp. MMS16-BH015]|uniref:hypothetical protein n=1 Tax=Kitasatospora sp. MMS16-BH015 TaxID=2018025 RepID=UPI000CA18156|nr:hypothetical protein [Kitasatospora sp. MMS16-BH015]AUG80807.1 hypothetical protein CFP65_6140 [Kitasatospora sp. MMS16-BH015]